MQRRTRYGRSTRRQRCNGNCVRSRWHSIWADILRVGFRLLADDPPDPNFGGVFVPVIQPSPVPLTGACNDLGTVATRNNLRDGSDRGLDECADYHC